MFSILLGSVFVPTLVFLLTAFFNSKKFLTKRLVFSFVICMIGFSILTNVLWLRTISGNVYNEWDPLLGVPHVMIAYDQPRFDMLHGHYFDSFFQTENPLQHQSNPYQGSWLAKSWSQFDLYLLWLGITFSVYIVTFFLLYFFNVKRVSQRKQFQRFLIMNFIVLTLFSAVCGLFDPWTVSILFYGLIIISTFLLQPLMLLHISCSSQSCTKLEMLFF